MTINLLIANSRKCDIENTNDNIDKFLKVFPDSKIFIFHDNTDLAECNYHEKATVLTLNKNIGLLYGRKYLVEHIPEEYDNELFCWLDSDDHIIPEKLQELKDFYDKNPDYEIIGSLDHISIWGLAIALKIFKYVYSYFPENPYGFRLHYYEDHIFLQVLKELIRTKKLDVKIFKCYIPFIDYTGYHNTDYSIPKNMQLFFEGLFVQYLWSKETQWDIHIPYITFNGQMSYFYRVYGVEKVNNILLPLLNRLNKYKPEILKILKSEEERGAFLKELIEKQKEKLKK